MAAPVLAAVDPTTTDLAPIRFGARIAAHTGAPLMIAAVFARDDAIDRLAGGLLGEELPRDPSAALERAAGAARDAAPKVSIDDTLQLGAASAPRGLALAAVEIGAALLVVGSREATPAGRTGVGSTAARLLDGAPCAVAVVPAGWEPAGEWDPIGAGFVDAVEGRAATNAAHLLAKAAGARMRVLAVVQPRAWMDGAGEEVAEDLRRRAEDAAAADTAGLFDTPVDIDVQVGDPAAALRSASGDLALLVCGARGYGPDGATVLGGVTRQVTPDAACPVIVLSRTPGVALDALVD
ncbi:MAG: hypothetical protein JWQ20_2222 [Conexibacter sp.]|nr:hypothetical protein [Conexibacter sp.]